MYIEYNRNIVFVMYSFIRMYTEYNYKYMKTNMISLIEFRNIL